MYYRKVDIENPLHSGVGYKEDEYYHHKPHLLDFYGQVIYTDDLYFIIDNNVVVFDNIDTYLAQVHQDDTPNMLTDNELIAYVEQKYKADVCKGE